MSARFIDMETMRKFDGWEEINSLRKFIRKNFSIDSTGGISWNEDRGPICDDGRRMGSLDDLPDFLQAAFMKTNSE